ncbi:hypothetical protein T08_12726 [Trichinella sp. T8]|nr:hypothetical protein T08_12726 [Trichinella sp. T8]
MHTPTHSAKRCSIKFDYFANLNQSNESPAPQFLRRSRFVQVSIKKVPTVNKDGGAHKRRSWRQHVVYILDFVLDLIFRTYIQCWNNLATNAKLRSSASFP